MQISKQAITWQQLNAFRHVNKIKSPHPQKKQKKQNVMLILSISETAEFTEIRGEWADCPELIERQQ